MFDLNEFAKEIHQNAVAHGWWEGERSADEIIALIHSEWSEALEEYRAGRPLVWHKCPYNSGMCEFQEVHNTGAGIVCDACTPDKRKPEGIAVELIDGCIRILDYFGREGYKLNEAFCEWVEIGGGIADPYFPKVITTLHKLTSQAVDEYECLNLQDAMLVAMRWIKKQGLAPFDLMREKHEYNKTRPYKHGGKVC